MRNLLVSSSYAPLKPRATSFVMGAEAGRIRKEKMKIKKTTPQKTQEANLSPDSLPFSLSLIYKGTKARGSADATQLALKRELLERGRRHR